MSPEIYDRVINHLQEVVPFKGTTLQMTPETEIYLDLGIYGDDLFEVLMWVQKEFKVNITLPGLRYAPGEIPFFRVIKLAKKIFGIKESVYSSLKVKDLVHAIEAGGGRMK